MVVRALQGVSVHAVYFFEFRAVWDGFCCHVMQGALGMYIFRDTTSMLTFLGYILFDARRTCDFAIRDLIPAISVSFNSYEGAGFG